jgi:hypothetical protein
MTERTEIMTHTPTPWTIDALGYLRGPESENILENHANAAYIVKCVNAHEDLLQSLKDLLHYGITERMKANAERSISLAEEKS